MSDSPPIVVEPPQPADASVIWLHGLGADGTDFEPIVPELGMPLTRHVRFVFPHAPERPVTVNGGYVMRAWFDVYDVDLPRRPDEEGIRASADVLRGLIAAEIERGIASSRVVIAGFSQGGAIALHTGLRHADPLAGILALSTYLPMPEAAAAEAHVANQRTPIFLAHGAHDPVIPIRYAEATREWLLAEGYPVEWHSYPMPHAVSARQIGDIGAWLSSLLG